MSYQEKLEKTLVEYFCVHRVFQKFVSICNLSTWPLFSNDLNLNSMRSNYTQKVMVYVSCIYIQIHRNCIHFNRKGIWYVTVRLNTVEHDYTGYKRVRRALS